LIGAMLNLEGATAKTKPTLNFATDLAREGLSALVKLARIRCGLSVAETLRALSKSSLPKPADNIRAPQ
jgi:hypothetical protein